MPFFLPVYLWTHGLNLSGMCILLGASGFAFCIALGFWQSFTKTRSLGELVTVTFLLEIALIVVVGLFTAIPGAPLTQQATATDPDGSVSLLISATFIGAANGFYNAFFWTTQRSLFLEQLGRNDTGKNYGNLQIVVAVFLKLGILLGGLLLDNGGFVLVLVLSAIVSAVSSILLVRSLVPGSRIRTADTRISLVQSLNYKDKVGSRSIFFTDGIFLYLESHFWTLSLFLVVRKDFSLLGIAVVLLAVAFSAVFFIIKNRIDNLPISVVYKIAVWLYAFSWFARFLLDHTAAGSGLLVTLILITFCSSFFRLTFNKHFFDVARRSHCMNYLLLKSYASQWVLGIFFSTLGILLFFIPLETDAVLAAVYAGATLLTLVYFLYITGRIGIEPADR